MDSAHYKVILSYNGSGFAGFQRQTAARTVQGEFEACLRKIGWQAHSILSAGRTDAGVHAKAQVISFRLAWSHTMENLRNALNYYLPDDMAVQAVMEVPPDFHPRYDAISRHYRYHCFSQPVRDPLREVFAWRVWPPLNLDWMNSATQNLLGSHDFYPFGNATTENGVTVREVFSAEWQQADDVYWFDITANAFLYHMVRRLTFVLVKIGQGEASVECLAESLATGNLDLAGLAPAAGLVLMEVNY